jgi:hypothetical protein
MNFHTISSLRWFPGWKSSVINCAAYSRRKKCALQCASHWLLQRADYTRLCYSDEATHRTRVYKTGYVRVMQMPLKLPPQYWHVVDKTFKQYLIIWSPGIKNISELKGEFLTPTASRDELYVYVAHQRRKFKGLNLVTYIYIRFLGNFLYCIFQNTAKPVLSFLH